MKVIFIVNQCIEDEIYWWRPGRLGDVFGYDKHWPIGDASKGAERVKIYNNNSDNNIIDTCHVFSITVTKG